MRCVCGNPMRQVVVALDDIWWTCLICSRTKPAVIEKEEPPKPPDLPHAWAIAVVSISKPSVKEPPTRSKVMSKTLSDLNDALFNQLNRLSDATGETLPVEIDRSRAVSNLAREIIENGKLALEAQRCLGGKKGNPKMLGVAE